MSQLTTGLWRKMSGRLRIWKKRETKSETSFMKNGRMLLEGCAASRNGKCNPIRIFSMEELKRATDNYSRSHVFYCDGYFKLYRGILQGRAICVKKFVTSSLWTNSAIDEVVIASQMSIHKNVLKLIGCCLETETPTLVHEFPKNGTLKDGLCVSQGACRQPLSWKCRLRIAADIASAVAYLHTAFPRPIIHRNIKPASVLLAENNVAKLSDFSFCIPIPDGESRVQEVPWGTWGFIAPEYLATGSLTEKADVYALGMLLFVLLTGHQLMCYDGHLNSEHSIRSDVVNYYAENRSRLIEILDHSVVEEARCPAKAQQLQDFIALAFRCINRTEEDRPTMTDVAKQLRQMERSALCCNNACNH
ncbi:non-functional pseudokinase ZED1-like [Malania oleifera]|uniref:non-functional pseudokinase ZED1-like n=1 Tax=Malania oleifera TaxID=397392 RepID=UPI0025AE727F|nr:non-functional pseudokinase ZED1-like [Malania oleifera]